MTKGKQVTEVGLKRMPAEQITEGHCDITITYFRVIRSFSELVYVDRRQNRSAVTKGERFHHLLACQPGPYTIASHLEGCRSL